MAQAQIGRRFHWEELRHEWELIGISHVAKNSYVIRGNTLERVLLHMDTQ